MLRKCSCGGNKVISQARANYPEQYDWHCDTCENYGVGWSFRPHLALRQEKDYFETQEEALEDQRS
jgi:hypothetical protein